MERRFGSTKWHSNIAINLKYPRDTMQLAAQRLRNGGRIINLSSSVVSLCEPTYGAYATTKAGVEAMTHVLSKELRGRDIAANAVAPEPTATDLSLDGRSQKVIGMLTTL
jgi:3-oxoacyl-[acyl-carrier protein] reductase